MFISPKRKITILKMALISFIISKLEHRMSRSWKQITWHVFETINKFDRMKSWVPDCSAQDFDKNVSDSKHVFKVYFKPSRKNLNFWFLSLSSKPVWLKTPYLIDIMAIGRPLEIVYFSHFFMFKISSILLKVIVCTYFHHNLQMTLIWYLYFLKLWPIFSQFLLSCHFHNIYS